MIDFTNLPVRNKSYAGANGSKISVVYNDELYMLKFPAVPAITNKLVMRMDAYQNIMDAMFLKVLGYQFRKHC